MKLQYSLCFLLLLTSFKVFSQETKEPHVCYPPNLKRSIKQHQESKVMVNPGILATGTVAYTQSIHNVIVKWSAGSYSSFRIGTAPGLQDIRWGQALNAASKHTSGHSYEELRKDALALGTTFNIGDTFYITMDNGLTSEWVSPPLVFQWENLGNPANNVTINIETSYGDGGFGPFAGWQETKMMAFYNLVNPIIKDVFGAPSRNHDVYVVNDAYAQGVNIYYNGPNQISSTYAVNADGDLDQPRLMIHELIHAYRDNVILSTSDEWHYDPTLSGFEEGMAEAVAIIVMDKFIDQYPNFFNGDEFKIHWNHSRGMPFSWDYDFQNNEQVRNRDYFSTDIATGSHWLRYGMGAMAFRKMYIEDNDIFKKFNAEYYNRLNADHSLLTTRDLLVDIFDTIASEVERTPVKDWINDQKILDCDTDIEKKVFMLTFTNISWQSFTQDNRIFFLETHQNGKEWQWTSSDNNGVNEIDEGDASAEKWGWTHQLNNTPGQFRTIQDWDNNQYGANKAMINDYHGLYDGQYLLGPYQGANPYYSFDGLVYNAAGWFTRDFMQNQSYSGGEMGKRALAIGSQQLYTSTATNATFWPTGIIAPRKITDLNQSGLYRWELDFNDSQGPTVSNTYFRLLGDDFVDVKGVFGGIYSDVNDSVAGKLIIEHEDYGEEADVLITNNSFKSVRDWVSVPEADVNRQGGRSDRKYSVPGKTHTIFISSDCTEKKIDFRTIGYGDGLDGLQMMLFKVEDFKDISFTETVDLDLCPGDTAAFSVSNNFPDILDGDSRITYQWLNPSGAVVSNVRDFNLASIVAGDQGTYTLEINFFGCVINKTVNLNVGCANNIDFDGTDDYANRSSLVTGLSASTMMGWIKTDEIRGADIMGQDSFRIYTNSLGQLSAEVKTGTTSIVTGGPSTVVTTNIWTHIAAVYDGVANTLTLYINGEEVGQTTTTNNALIADINDFEIGRRSNGDDRYFKGNMQEIRVYDVALSLTQLQEQVYQQIENNGGVVRGSAIPNDIDNSTLNWGNLVLYLKLDPAAIVGGVTVDESSGANGLIINNMTTTQVLGAPIPYQASISGGWTVPSTWTNGAEWDITSLPNKDWAIVQVTNNAKVTTTASHTHLGLLVDSGSELEIQNDQLLNNTSYVKLDGQIDLVGESQLIQTTNSDLDVTSTGYLERDQDGKSNLYQYNYWSSPVGTINNTVNNQAYSVAGILRDGTTPATPQAISFIGGYNGAPGSPISLAEFWVFKFIDSPDAYANWTQPLSAGTFQVGEGFTLKGSGAATATQNYTFTGKPNNGVIQHAIGGNNKSLLGNPYPSALDADAFINANIGANPSTTGTLYFWEHWGGTSHYLAQYEGGYATYNLLGGVLAISDPMVSSNGSGTLAPQQYVPVAQGFMVQGDPDGGTVDFTNAQRAFQKESGANSTFIRSAEETSENDTNSEAAVDKVYFTFTTPEGPTRQLLLGVKEGLTEGIEHGYDAKRYNEQHTDCGWDILEESYVIQGIGSVYTDLELPLTIKVGTAGECQFNVDSLADLDDNIEVYFKDTELGIVTPLEQNQGASFTLEAGQYTNRFSVVFKVTEREIEEVTEVEELATDNLVVYYNTQLGAVSIVNSASFSASNIKVFNVLGQEVLNHDKQHQDITEVLLPVQVSSGAYLVQFVYNNGKEITKKIIIQ